MENLINLNKKFTVDTVITVFALIITALCGFGINIIIQKGFNNEGLGVFSYIFSVFFIINSIGTLGMNRAMVYFTAYYYNNIQYRNHLITNALLLVTVWTLILFGIIHLGIDVLFYKILSHDQCSYLGILSYAVPIYCLNNVAIAVLNGARRMKIYSLLRSLRWVVLVICLIILSKKQSLEVTFYSFIICEIIILSLVTYIFVKSKYIIVNYNQKSFTEILNYVKFVYPSQILVSLNENIDIVILENFVSDGNLGIYSFSSKVAKSLGLIGGAIQTNFNPVISSLFKDNSIYKLREFSIRLRSISLKIFSFLIVLAAISYYLLIEFYIKDDSFKELYKYYILQSLAAGLYASFSWAGAMLIMTGKIKENIYRGLLKLILIILLTFICVISLPLEYGMYVGFSLVMLSQLFIDRYFIAKYVGIKIF